MAKASEDLKDLQRRLSMLDRMRGRVLFCAEGPYLVRKGEVRDPGAVWNACRRDLPRLADLTGAIHFASAPVALSARLLAKTQRDLHVLEGAPGLLARMREAPRMFRRYADVNRAWLAELRANMDLLSHALRQKDFPASPFERALGVVAALHGDAWAEQATRMVRASERSGGRKRARALRTIESIVTHFSEGGPLPTGLDSADLVWAARSPGRRQDRRLVSNLCRALGVALGAEELDAVAHRIGQDSPSLRVRRAGTEILKRLPSTRAPDLVARLQRLVATYALVFEPEPWAVPPELVAPALHNARKNVEKFRGYQLTIRQVLALAPLLSKTRHHKPIARLVERGLAVDSVKVVANLKHLDELAELDDVAAARAFSAWVGRLVPHYEKLGVPLLLRARPFVSLAKPKRFDLAALAAVLSTVSGAEPGVEEQLERLDATLGLFERRPERAAKLIDALGGTSTGLGTKTHREFAAWLGDDELLDRHLHLSALAEAGSDLPDAPASISHALLEDFERARRFERERAFLESCPRRNEKQEARLQRLLQVDTPPSPARTKRRLRSRQPALLSRAFRQQLDVMFRDLIAEAWGVHVPTLSPAWLNVVRYYLRERRNRELLRNLLRAAASTPPQDCARWAANRAWIERGGEHFEVDAWLAPRRQTVQIGGETCLLEVESNPVEVLHMGVPFDTCLSIERGFNAAATVVNAVDVNKAVVYARNRRGGILARKLIAVSKDWKLIGYQVYVSADGKTRRPLAEAVDHFCTALAADARLEMSSHGEPEQLHEGFWYDDGPEAFFGREATPDMAAFCEATGLSPALAAKFQADVDLFDARCRSDVDAAVSAIEHGACFSHGDATWLRANLAPREAIRRSRDAENVLRALMEAAPNVHEALAFAGRVSSWSAGEVARSLVQRSPFTLRLGKSLVEAARASMKSGHPFNDHGLEHLTMYLLPHFVARADVAKGLDLLDSVEPVWAYVVEQSESCADCRTAAEIGVFAALYRAYRRSPDPDEVVRTLGSKRRSRLARLAALEIAWRVPLVNLTLSPLEIVPSRREVAIAARRALFKLIAHEPSVATSPEMFSAIVRQSGGDAKLFGDLPSPKDGPFSFLRELSFIPALEPHLAKWTSVEPKDPWALAYHRRRDTPWRRRILARAGWNDGAALGWAALLGEYDRVKAIVGSEIAPVKLFGEEKTSIWGHELIALARVVSAQIDAHPPCGPWPSGGTHLTGKWAGWEIDALALQEAARRVDSAIRSGESLDDLESEVEMMLWAEWENRVELLALLSLFAGGAKESALCRRTVLRLLKDRSSWPGGLAHEPECMELLWREPSWRSPLVDRFLMPAACAEVGGAERLLRFADLEGFAEAWAQRFLDQADAWALSEVRDSEVEALLAEHLARHPKAATVLPQLANVSLLAATLRRMPPDTPLRRRIERSPRA